MKKLMTLVLSLFVLAAFAQQRESEGPKRLMKVDKELSCPSFVMQPVDGTTLTANHLIENILGEDILSYNLINFQGTEGIDASAGIFTGGINAGISIESGIVLSSGFIANAIGPNISSGISGVLNLPGDSDLNNLIPQSTLDATILEFEFVPTFDQIFIQFVFGSDEYNEYVGSGFNDVFGFFLNGVNIALTPGTEDPITINTINLGLNSDLYINNDPFHSDLTEPIYCTEMDGFTTVLVVEGAVIPGETNTIKLAIADAGDRVLDSWVFIGAEGFTGIIPDPDPDPDPTPVPLGHWSLIVGMGLILLFTFLRLRRIL
ncbi:MAG: PEP-CTERM sorting domain-containing protein [Bacteroidetes bacterium]|nr:MAG: PEP-CTERM sorting domain-containing protein [Bacteroidota bacterium]